MSIPGSHTHGPIGLKQAVDQFIFCFQCCFFLFAMPGSEVLCILDVIYTREHRSEYIGNTAGSVTFQGHSTLNFGQNKE